MPLIMILLSRGRCSRGVDHREATPYVFMTCSPPPPTRSSIMNVFVLSTGRAGTHTFARACQHLTNFSCSHESRWGRLGRERLDYPPRHIEVDNRLAWYLGRLHRRFGDDAFYVHMIRDRQEVADSFINRRMKRLSIVRAYAYGLVVRDRTDRAVATDLWDTVTANIRLFLEERPRTMEIRLAEAQDRFPEFLDRVGAEGDLDAAVAAWDRVSDPSGRPPLVQRIIDRFRFGP